MKFNSCHFFCQRLGQDLNLDNAKSYLLLASVLWFSFLPIIAKATDAKQTHHYQVNIDENISNADVKICFDGEPPEYLKVDYKSANRNLIKRPKVSDKTIKIEGRYWNLKSLPEDVCLSYQVDVSAHNNRHGNQQSPQPILAYFSDNTWLWLPEKLGENESVVIDFKLPASFRVSAPWFMLDESGHRFELGRLPLDWGYPLVIGEFDLKQLQIGQSGQLNIAVLNNIKNANLLQDWIKNSAESLTSYLGDFPVKQLQMILVQSRKKSRSPVPWGEIQRGSGFSIILVLDSQRPESSFYQDWTISHEFAHLLVPNIRYKDIWLSEGLASYLQYILMARGGHLTESQAWEKMFAGFQRGERGTQQSPSEPLSQTVNNRGKYGAAGRTKRIYWSGAVYFLHADLMLLKGSKGKKSLSTVLRKLNQCCIYSTTEWTGKALASKLDELSQTKVFSKLFEEYAHSTKFPNYSILLNDLGIHIDKERLVLSDENASWRQRIIFGKAGAD